ncbi:hypothetical protein Tco_0088197 [Tanacetum coccineum]
MAESIEEQQRQQKLKDVALVPVYKHIQIPSSNLRITLERIQPEFWYTITQELSTQKFYIQLDNQVMEVNADLIRNALKITPRITDHPFTSPPPEKTIINIIDQLGCNKKFNGRLVVMIGQDFQCYRSYRERLLAKMLTSLNSFGTNLDTKLRCVGTPKTKMIICRLKDLIFGMPIPEVMLTNDLKASADYLDYLAKSRGHTHLEDVATTTTPPKATSRGKGLLTKNEVVIAVYKVSIPKRKRTQRVVEEIGQNDEVANEADSKATDEEEVEPLIRHRNIRIRISRNTSQESKAVEEEISDEPHLKGSKKEARVTLEVPDRPGDDSSSLSSKIAIEHLSSDDDEVLVNDADMSMQAEDATDIAVIATDSIAEVTENDNTVTLTSENVKMTDVKMNPSESKVQSMVDVPVTKATPVALRHPPIESTVNLAPDTDLLFRMMDKAKTFKRHPKHKALYDALAASLIFDKDNMDRVFETLDSPNLYSRKEPSATAGPEQTWFIDLEKNAKDPADVDDIFGTTFDFSNFVKHRLQKDTLTKADLEGPINPEGDSTPKDFNNPLPLVGSPNHLYIQASHFINKDLEYLRTGNLEEKKYSASTTKTRAIRILVDKQQGYGYLKDNVEKRENQKEYILKEADFPSLHLNDIKDMFLGKG